VSQLRLNPLNGRWVTVATGRAARPGGFAPRRLPVQSDPQRPCPFCPGNEEATAPALETYGRDGHWLVRVMPNLYPAFNGRGDLRVTELGPIFKEAPAVGVHEVLVLSPHHDRPWGALDDKQAGLAMAAIRDRVEDHARHAGVLYTQTIVNHGREAGASVEHPHGQLLGIPFVPGELAEELERLDAFERDHRSCLLCETIVVEEHANHRVVQANERVSVICPFWSGAPYEMLVLPRRHEAHLAHATPADLVAMGRAIRDALARLDRVVGDVAYNLVFHTAPHHHGGAYHWHVHVLPRMTSAAGFEEGTGVLINIVAPEQAAEQLTASG
jgi:UDPglucose--hexose-1-phosphate uridylyltransferase